ncbi:MAG: hypothetical protein WA890_17770 [Micromonospora sp.]
MRPLPVLEWGGLALVSLIGIGWLLLEWRSGRCLPPREVGWRVPTAALGASVDPRP